MTGLNFETAKKIIIMSRSRSSGTAYNACKNAIKSITSRKNFSEIYKKLKPYISSEKSIRKNLSNESFIRNKENYSVELKTSENRESEQMSILGKMVAACNGDSAVFENTYGKTYNEFLDCM